MSVTPLTPSSRPVPSTTCERDGGAPQRSFELSSSSSRPKLDSVGGYSLASPILAADLSQIAKRIRQRVTNQVASVIATGNDLIAAKRALRSDGRLFCKWVKTELGMEIRAAQNYMSAARVVAQNENFSLLSPSALYRVAAKSTDENVRTQVLA